MRSSIVLLVCLVCVGLINCQMDVISIGSVSSQPKKATSFSLAPDPITGNYSLKKLNGVPADQPITAVTINSTAIHFPNCRGQTFNYTTSSPDNINITAIPNPPFNYCDGIYQLLTGLLKSNITTFAIISNTLVFRDNLGNDVAVFLKQPILTPNIAGNYLMTKIYGSLPNKAMSTVIINID